MNGKNSGTWEIIKNNFKKEIYIEANDVGKSNKI